MSSVGDLFVGFQLNILYYYEVDVALYYLLLSAFPMMTHPFKSNFNHLASGYQQVQQVYSGPQQFQ